MYTFNTHKIEKLSRIVYAFNDAEGGVMPKGGRGRPTSE